MHTLAAWEKRMGLRRTVAVREALQTWWVCAMATVRMQREDELEEAIEAALAAGQPPPVADTGVLHMDRDAYFLIYKRIMRALAEETEDEYDESEAEEYAQDDWRSESRDGISMPREVFLDSLFQIADLYTDLANEHEYGSFLARILQRCVR